MARSPLRNCLERKPHFFKVLLGDFSNRLKKRCRPPKTSLNFGSTISLQKACEIDSKNHLSNNLCTVKHSFPDKYNSSPKPEGVVRIETEDLDLPASVAETVHYLGRTQHVMSEENRKAQERANSITSDFPFFTKIINANHVRRGCVPIPVSFARAHPPKGRVKIILQDPKGKAWEVKHITYHGWSALSAGWIAFAHGNNLVEGDSWIFELVGKLKMCVHIFRFSEENKAQIKSQAM
ncbi:B3 domain-containing protein Os01g0723500-like isoform X4 [Tasmannia lanceolata]